MSALSNNATQHKAWVMFSGKTDLRWLNVLKPGFRHCYVLLNDGQRWISYDPLSPHTEIIAHHHIPAEFDLPSWLKQRGQISVFANIQWDLKKPAPVMFFTCVEAVKRVLGLHQFFIFTPWQLYRHLTHKHSDRGEFIWDH
ncbi:MAG: hypothetical protein AAF569_04105 [Pseudomonadota bacterium]